MATNNELADILEAKSGGDTKVVHLGAKLIREVVEALRESHREDTPHDH